jgi:hypothetical protein
VRRRRWPRLRKKIKKKIIIIVVLDKAIAELKRMLRLRLRGLRPEGQHRTNYTAVLDFMRAQRVVLGGARRKPIIKKFTAIEMASFNPPSRKDIALFEVMISGHNGGLSRTKNPGSKRCQRFNSMLTCFSFVWLRGYTKRTQVFAVIPTGNRFKQGSPLGLFCSAFGQATPLEVTSALVYSKRS